MGFPDTFKIPVSDTRAYKQFGNSVVVPLVEKVACEIVEALRRPKLTSQPGGGRVRRSDQLGMSLNAS